ncbi:MAG: HigA family addiction module antidote protein [Acidobacteria bacterium]|nr:HigA family addiction module antidote protein [Acidobacteriota bacterium]
MKSKSRTTIKKVPPVHPGDVLREDFLRPLGMSITRLAIALCVPATRMAEIVHRERAITSDTALRLARFFGTTPEFWLNMQAAFELQVASDKLSADIDRTVHPYEARAW